MHSKVFASVEIKKSIHRKRILMSSIVSRQIDYSTGSYSRDAVVAITILRVRYSENVY